MSYPLPPHATPTAHLKLTRSALAGLALWLLAAAAPPPGGPQLKLVACELEHPLRLAVLPAQCGVLTVPENPKLPQGRQIGLHVARVLAVSRRKQPDPLFVLAGGPGAAAIPFYVTVAGAFGRIQRERDIVLVDQRGTGSSAPLECGAEEDELSEHASAAQIAASTRACLAALAARADVTQYTTSIAVQDLERVRSALGYERINLYGVSYGTRVAQLYLRRFPARVRSVILDGVVPVAAALGETSALDAEAALAEIFARCAADAACHKAYGDPAADYRSVRAALAAAAVEVTVPPPAGGAPKHFSFGPDELALVLRLGSYGADYAALLPLLLHQAASGHDYGPLASQYLLLTRATGELIATGMHNSVACAEDVPFFTPGVDRAALAATYLGTVQLDGLTTMCRIWPHGPVDPDLHAPLTSEVAALLLSGGADPVTPPRFAQSAARSYPHGLALLLPGFGHGQLTDPCMDRVMAQFLARGSATGLDVSCTHRARPLAFFTSVNGPAP